MRYLAVSVGLALAFSATAFAQDDGATTVAADSASFIAPPSFQFPREIKGKVRIARALHNGGSSTPVDPAAALIGSWGPPTTVLVGNTVITGKLATELEGFEDQEVVVRGYDRIDRFRPIPGPAPVVPFDSGDSAVLPSDTSIQPLMPPPFRRQIFEGQSFAPVAELEAQSRAAGEALDYVTGIVTVKKEVVNIGKDRTDVQVTVSLDTLTGESFEITDELTKNRLAGLDKNGNPLIGSSDADGATVTMFGKIAPHRDPLATELKFANKSARILARGKLSPLYHIMRAADANALRTAAPGTLTPSAQPMIAIWPPQDWADYGLSITSRNATGQKFFPLYKGDGLTIPQGSISGNQTHWVTIEVGDKKMTLKKISEFPVEFSAPVGPIVPLHTGSNVGIGTDTVPSVQPADLPADGSQPSGLNRGSTSK